MWAPIPWSCAAHIRKRPSAENASLAGGRQISGPARGVEVGPARQRSSDGIQIVRAGVTGAPWGEGRARENCSSTSTMPPSKRTPKLSASFCREVAARNRLV